MKPVPTDPYVKVSLIRFLGSNPFTELETKPAAPSLAHNFAVHKANQILWTILGLGSG